MYICGNQSNCLGKFFRLGKNLPCLEVKSIFLTTNQLICFRLTLTESFARRTHIYACTSTYIYTEIYIHLCIYALIHTCRNKAPQLSHRPHCYVGPSGFRNPLPFLHNLTLLCCYNCNQSAA